MKTLDQDFPPLVPAELKPQTSLEALAKLREPFPAHQISKLPKPTKKQTEDVKANYKLGVRCAICGTWHHPDVIHLDYVGHAALTDRLLDTDPAWSWEPMSVDSNGLPALDKDGGMWIKLTVCGVTRLGYGDAQGKTGGDAMKERIGDALRNAAMRFGAALDLWHKGDLHLPEADKEDEESTEFAESLAMQVRSLMSKQDVAGAAAALNTLGVGGSYDGEAKEAVWSRLESPLRSAIKAYESIVNSKTLDALRLAWEATPKHSKTMLEPIKDARKEELTPVEQKEAA